LHYVANNTTPNKLILSKKYVIKIGENTKKNLKLKKLEIPTKIIPVIPKAMIEILYLLSKNTL